mmetsp:Transcript_42845/g.100598  ORF Transcript_42845/g.100598 Transcript_42845/m.100598 type:complete len:95 (-) Transcript_42845:78-362(-)
MACLSRSLVEDGILAVDAEEEDSPPKLKKPKSGDDGGNEGSSRLFWILLVLFVFLLGVGMTFVVVEKQEDRTSRRKRLTLRNIIMMHKLFLWLL